MKNKKVVKKILVADDDTAIVDALQIMLEDAGYEVITTTDGKTVTKMMDAEPNLLLLDIWMSGMDGRDICRELKKNKNTHLTPIIIVSANRDTAQIAKEAGADNFLVKPFQMNDLLKMIEKYTT